MLYMVDTRIYEPSVFKNLQAEIAPFIIIKTIAPNSQGINCQCCRMINK